MSAQGSKVVSAEPLDGKDARITYIDPTGQQRTWESSQRLTRPAKSDIDGVGIVAILQNDPRSPVGDQRSRGPKILLQKQFRPPINKVTVEVPAGLIDPGETPEQCALRELKEETGYVGQVLPDGFGVSPIMFNDPGFCSTNLRMLHVTVDLSSPDNRDPKPQLEDNEFIDCFSVPLADLYDECRRLEAQGYAIDARVGTLAEGIEIARRWKLVQ